MSDQPLHPDELREADPRYKRGAAPRDHAPSPPASIWRALRGAVVDLFSELTERRPERRYPRRPANFFTKDGKPHFHGHRERLRQRFLATGPEGLPDYELLELLLFNAIWKIDVKPLAKKLLETFGSLDAVVAAPESRLLQVPGVDRWVVLQLRIAGAFAQRLARAQINGQCVIGSWSETIAYCRTVMAYRDREQLRVLYLDQRNHLLEDAQITEGTINAVPVYAREVVRRGIELGAAGLIMLHNHPSGDPKPSDADIAMTKKVRVACDAVGLRFYDHVVIGRGSEASFHELGLLR
jgi:DNA repair protein RadC